VLPAELYEHATSQADSEGWLDHLLGLDCYTQAVLQLSVECNAMDIDQRCWLAIHFTMCFQKASGLKQQLGCSCSKRQSTKACVQACTAKMDERAYSTYSQFFTNVHR
jgi:hypothetical protein